MTTAVQLGNSANLLLGLRPGWFGGAGDIPFDPTPRAALIGFATPEPSQPGSWSEPEISFHDTVESLVDALFIHRVRPVLADVGRFTLPVSTLMLGAGRREAALASLCAMLGVPADRLAEGSLVLLRLRREDADYRHEAEEGGVGRRIHIDSYWTREGRHAVGRLRVAERGCRHAGQDTLIHRRQADRYLGYLYDYGTHFVSRVGVGEELFQVLVCDRQRYGPLRILWSQAAPGGTITSAKAFATHMGREWIALRSHICSAARDPEIERSVAEGAWGDPRDASLNSLLAPFGRLGNEVPKLLANGRRSVPIRIEWTSHSPYMENHRAIAWQRILKGALLQRFGNAVQVPEDRTHAAHREDGAVMLRNGAEVTLSGDVIAFDARLTAPVDSSASLHVFARHLVFNGAEVIPLGGRQVTVFGLAMDAGRKQDLMPVLQIDSTAFVGFRCFTSLLHGAFALVDETGQSRDTFFEGLRFSEDEHGRVIVRDDLGLPDADAIRPFRIPLSIALDDIEAQLIRAAADSDADAEHATRQELEWLLAVLRDSQIGEIDDPHRTSWAWLQQRACFLAKFGPVRERSEENPQTNTMAELLLRQRVLMASPHLADDDEVHALAGALEDASWQLSDGALSHVNIREAQIFVSDLEQRLADMNAARKHGADALRILLGELVRDVSLASSPEHPSLCDLIDTIACHWDDEAPSFSSSARFIGDESLALVLERVMRAERDLAAWTLLHALAVGAEQMQIDAMCVAVDNGEAASLLPDEWNSLSSVCMERLAPILKDEQSIAVIQLREAFDDIGRYGHDMGHMAIAIKRYLQHRYRRVWHDDASHVSQQPIERLYRYSRHIRTQLAAAKG